MNNIFYIAGWAFLALFLIFALVIFGSIFMASQKDKKAKAASEPVIEEVKDNTTIKFESVGSNKKKALLLDKDKKKKVSSSQLAENVFKEKNEPVGFAPRNTSETLPTFTPRVTEAEKSFNPFDLAEDEETPVVRPSLPVPPPVVASERPVSAPFAIRRSSEDANGKKNGENNRPTLPPPPPSFGR